MIRGHTSVWPTWRVTNRVTLAAALKKRIPGFDHYRDTVDSDHLIVQWESLHRVSVNRQYDLVVVESTCVTMHCYLRHYWARVNCRSNRPPN
jgi:hypothetical protein